LDGLVKAVNHVAGREQQGGTAGGQKNQVFEKTEGTGKGSSHQRLCLDVVFEPRSAQCCKEKAASSDYQKSGAALYLSSPSPQDSYRPPQVCVSSPHFFNSLFLLSNFTPGTKAQMKLLQLLATSLLPR
jgi:hypothetical protein